MSKKSYVYVHCVAIKILMNTGSAMKLANINATMRNIIKEEKFHLQKVHKHQTGKVSLVLTAVDESVLSFGQTGGHQADISNHIDVLAKMINARHFRITIHPFAS